MTFPKNILNKALPLLLLIVSAAVIFYRFPAVPHNLAYDEVEFAKLALDLKNYGYTPYSPLATGHSTLYFYTLLGSLETFGVNRFALRFPSALFGVINTVLFYFILQKVFERKTSHKESSNFFVHTSYILPFLLAIMFATMRWYFHFAKFSFEVTFLLMLEFISLLAILKYSENKNKLLLAIAGLFAGLAYNSYQPGRIFIAVPFFLLVFHEIKFRFFNKKNILLLVTFLVPFVAAVMPLTIYFKQHEDTRIYQQFYPMNFGLPVSTRLGYFWHNFSTNLMMFHVKGDVNGRHNYPGKPIVNPIIGILLIAGLILTLKNIKNKYNQLFLVYFIIGFTPTLMTYPWENPNMLRIFTTIPAVIYFVGNVFYFILERNIPIKKNFILAAIALTVLISGAYDIRTYFKYHATIFHLAFEMTGDLDKLIKMPSKP